MINIKLYRPSLNHISLIRERLRYVLAIAYSGSQLGLSARGLVRLAARKSIAH